MATKASISIITPVGLASYPNLLEPKANDKGKLMYGVQLLISKARVAELAAMKKAALDVAVAKWGATKGPNIVAAAKYPLIRDGDTHLDEDTGKPKAGYAGMYFISCKSNRKPNIIDAKKNVVFTDDDETGIYAGCLIRLQGSIFPYEQEGNKGVTFWFDNVQVVGRGPRLDGRKKAEDVFDEYEEVADPLA